MNQAAHLSCMQQGRLPNNAADEGKVTLHSAEVPNNCNVLQNVSWWQCWRELLQAANDANQLRSSCTLLPVMPLGGQPKTSHDMITHPQPATAAEGTVAQP